MKKSSKAGPNDPYFFPISRMGRTVALTKTIIFLKKYLEQLKQRLLQLLRGFVLLLSAVFILAVGLKMEVNK